MIGHLSGEMMLIKREPPISASFEGDVGWHSSMLSLGAVVTSGALGRSWCVMINRRERDARGLQIRHAWQSFFVTRLVHGQLARGLVPSHTQFERIPAN
jgi:hypothetical protein